MLGSGAVVFSIDHSHGSSVTPNYFLDVVHQCGVIHENGQFLEYPFFPSLDGKRRLFEKL